MSELSEREIEAVARAICCPFSAGRCNTALSECQARIYAGGLHLKQAKAAIKALDKARSVKCRARIARDMTQDALLAGIEKLRPTPCLTELEVHPLYKPARRISDAPILYRGPEWSYLEDENIGGW